MSRNRALAVLVAFAVVLVTLGVVPEASALGPRRPGFSTGDAVTKRDIYDPSQVYIADPSELVAIRVGRHVGFERIVFEFRGSLPSSQSVRYVPRVLHGESGASVPVAGRAFLEVKLTVRCGPPRGVMLEAGKPPEDTAALCPPSPGMARGARTLRQVVKAGYSQGAVTYGVGVRSRVGFRVFELSNPPRVVVDVRR